jgi:uncharacterized alpha-E superfamily protein
MGHGGGAMNQLLTGNVATSLYWLGRYLERIEITLNMINDAYDLIIDVDKNAGVALYKRLGIDISYTKAREFLSEAIRGDHPANLPKTMVQARENAIIARANIDASAFGEIIELHGLFQKIANSGQVIDYRDIDIALSLISEIWGAQDKKGHRRCSDYFLRLGKHVEELDFRLRFNSDKETVDLILEDIDAIFKILDPEFELDLETLKQSDRIMEDITKLMDKLIVA